MLQLFSSYSVGEIFLFIIIIALAIKLLISFSDWANDRMGKQVDKTRLPKKIEERLELEIGKRDLEMDSLRNDLDKIKESVSLLNNKILLLISSDKDDIKAWITAQHHHFTEKGYIDYYSLDCINRRYDHYKMLGGNTFIDDLIKEINNLPTK